jgi:hypothetical protein
MSELKRHISQRVPTSTVHDTLRSYNSYCQNFSLSPFNTQNIVQTKHAETHEIQRYINHAFVHVTRVVNYFRHDIASLKTRKLHIFRKPTASPNFNNPVSITFHKFAQYFSITDKK